MAKAVSESAPRTSAVQAADAPAPARARDQIGHAGPRYSLANIPVEDPGQPLPSSVRGDAEGRLGRQLPDVRVHVGGHADQAARNLGASAFTVGRDVYFASRKFAPHSPVGRQLLTHELAHVAQQSGSSTAAPGAAHEAEADAVAAAPRGARMPVSQTSAFGSLQCSPGHHAGHKEAVVTVHWTSDTYDFEDRVIEALETARGFRGVPHDIFQGAFNSPLSDLHAMHVFNQGHKVRVRVSADYDPDAYVELSNVHVELVEAAAAKPAKATAAPAAPAAKATGPVDQHTWLGQTIGKKVADADARGYDGYEVTISSGMGTVISHEAMLGKPGTRPSGIGEISAQEAGSDITSQLGFVESSPGAYTFTFQRDARSHAMHLQSWHKDSDYKPAKVVRPPPAVATQPLTDEQRLEQEIGMPSPQRINRGLAKLGGKLIRDSNPVNAKNLPYTIAGIVIPMGGMKLLMMDTEELTFTWELTDETDTAQLSKGSLVDTSEGTQEVVGLGEGKLVTKPYTPPAEAPEAAQTPTVADPAEAPTTETAEKPAAPATEAEAATTASKPYVAQPREEVDPTKVDVYRGGNSFELKPGEYRFDKATKTVKPLRGPSLNTDPTNKNIVNNGGAYKITSIPKELKIYQHADTAGTHLEIVPRTPMTLERFQQLLREIVVVAR